MTNLSRRGVLAAAAAAAAAPFVTGDPAQAAGERAPKTWDLTLLGTSDTHGNVYNWDYYRDAEYDDGAHNDVGLAKVATLVNQVRAERRGKATLVLDAGDTIQGTPLATYYAKQEPITTTHARHPMARAMNVIRYDAVTLGNHEFNYGLPLLDLWIRQLGFPALAANAVSAKTGRPAFTPYIIKKVDVGHGAPQLRVGILGLTNPASRSGTAATSRASCASRT
jgi:2',3'-cyclic-nucleotide 2'-phosphodiesterase/3'-nucleotidase